MIRIKLRKSKIILEGLPGQSTYERESLAFIDEGLGADRLPLVSIRNVWEDNYVVYKRRISEIVDEQSNPIPVDEQGSVAGPLNELTVGASDLPAGGEPGQLLLKSSTQDYDAAWSSLPDLTLYFENHLL